MKTKILICSIALVLFLVSCNKEEPRQESFSTEEISMNAKIDASNNDVQHIVENQFEVTLANATLDGVPNPLQLPACAIVTRIPTFGTTPNVGQLISKTINFGVNGCALPNGNILKGKITISFNHNPTAISHVIAYEFDEFYHNNIRYNGTKTFVRTMSVASASNPSHPVAVMNMTMTATFPNGKMITRIGSRTREIIEGYSTSILSDNIWKITGDWTTSFPNANIQTSTITTPLIVRGNCPNIVRGIITFVRSSNTATLDYGGDTCDNQAVFTLSGVATNITLGN